MPTSTPVLADMGVGRWEWTLHLLGEPEVALECDYVIDEFLAPGCKKCSAEVFPTFTTSRPRTVAGRSFTDGSRTNFGSLLTNTAQRYVFEIEGEQFAYQMLKNVKCSWGFPGGTL